MNKRKFIILNSLIIASSSSSIYAWSFGGVFNEIKNSQFGQSIGNIADQQLNTLKQSTNQQLGTLQQSASQSVQPYAQAVGQVAQNQTSPQAAQNLQNVGQPQQVIQQPAQQSNVWQQPVTQVPQQSSTLLPVGQSVSPQNTTVGTSSVSPQSQSQIQPSQPVAAPLSNGVLPQQSPQPLLTGQTNQGWFSNIVNKVEAKLPTSITSNATVQSAIQQGEAYVNGLSPNAIQGSVNNGLSTLQKNLPTSLTGNSTVQSLIQNGQKAIDSAIANQTGGNQTGSTPKNLGKDVFQRLSSVNTTYIDQLTAINQDWANAVNVVLQNLKTLPVSDPSYGKYLETGNNMVTVIPIVVQGNYKPYNDTWSLIQDGNNVVYDINGNVSQSIKTTITAAQVSDLINKMLNVQINYGAALTQLDAATNNTSGLSASFTQTFASIKNGKPTDPFYQEYATIGSNQVIAIPVIIEKQGALRPSDASWSSLVDANGVEYNVDGTQKTQPDGAIAPQDQESKKKRDQVCNQLMLMDYAYSSQLTGANASWRVAYYKTYTLLKNMDPNDPFFNIYGQMATNQLALVPQLLQKNAQNQNNPFSPADNLWSKVKDAQGVLYDLSFNKMDQTSQQSPDATKVDDLMNQIIQMDLDNGSKVKKEWRLAYEQTYNLLLQSKTNVASNNQVFLLQYQQAASNQIAAIPVLLQLGGRINPVPGNVLWDTFVDDQGATYTVDALIKLKQSS